MEDSTLRTTYLANPNEIDRKWYIVDATDIPMGRLSTVVASILRGKKTSQLLPLTWIRVIM